MNVTVSISSSFYDDTLGGPTPDRARLASPLLEPSLIHRPRRASFDPTYASTPTGIQVDIDELRRRLFQGQNLTAEIQAHHLAAKLAVSRNLAVRPVPEGCEAPGTTTTGATTTTVIAASFRRIRNETYTILPRAQGHKRSQVKDGAISMARRHLIRKRFKNLHLKTSLRSFGVV